MAYYPKDVGHAVERECNRRRLSPRTTKTYLFCINRFLKYCDKKGKGIQHVSKKDVRLFLEKHAERGLSGSSLNTYHMAIKFLFEQVLDKKMWIDIKYSKVRKKIPTFLTKKEVEKLIESISNHKHKIMIAFMYSAGLRVSELINLRVRDLELRRRFGYVKNGKGGKDRIFVVSERLVAIIQQIITNNRLEEEDYLFSSMRNKKYNTATIRKIIKSSVKKSRIKKNVHPHTLRHSFTTHLIDNGHSISEVQAILGHKSPETTLTYLHTASSKLINIKSPLDKL